MRIFSLVKSTYSRWSDHEGQRLGAALSFYALLSATPLLVLAVVIGSAILGRDSAEQRIVDYIQQNIGPSAASMVQTIMTHALHPHHSDLAAAIATGALLFGASSAFIELREDLNKMWDAHAPKGGWIGLIVQRIFAFLLVLGAGLILLASMLATATLSVIARFFGSIVPVPAWLLEVGNIVLSFVILGCVFLLIFRFVPDKRLPWRALFPGALASALLFAVGKAVLTLYLIKIGVGSAYGAAGAVVAAAFFIYYAAQIFLFGAEFTYIWAGRKMQTGVLAPSDPRSLRLRPFNRFLRSRFGASGSAARRTRHGLTH